MIPQKTRCPSCESVFAVTAEQLAARQGQVRCGRCFKVFKADDHLVSAEQARQPDTPVVTGNPSRVKSSVMDLISRTPPAQSTRNNIPASRNPTPPIHRAVDVNAAVQGQIPPAIEAIPAPLEPVAAAPAAATADNGIPRIPPLHAPASDSAQPSRRSARHKAITPDMIHDDMPIDDDDATPASPATAKAAVSSPQSHLLLDEELSDFFLEQESRPRDPTAKENRDVVKLNAAADESWAEALLDEIFEDNKELRPDDALALQPDHPTIPPKSISRTSMRVPVQPPRRPAAQSANPAGIQTAITEADELASLNEDNPLSERKGIAPAPVIRAKPAGRASGNNEDSDNLSSFLKSAGAASVAETQVFDSLPSLDQPPATAFPKSAPPSPYPNIRQATRPDRPAAAASSTRAHQVRTALGIPTMRSLKRNLGYYLAWSALCGLMLSLLVVQYVYFNFNQLSTSHHELMQSVCRQVGCELPALDASVLQLKQLKASRSPLGNGITRFNAQLVNQSDSTQQMPNLRLALYDKGQVSAGVIVQPAVYLTGDRRDISRLPSQRPIPIEFDVQIPRNQVAKYTLEPQF